MRVVAHISDLHFGREDKQVLEGLIRDLNAKKPSLVVVSGDLTQRALRRQFSAARAFLKRITAPILVVPGNHDIPFFDITRRFLLPLQRYKYFISKDVNPVYRDKELSVIGINSARSLAVQNGTISKKQLNAMRETCLAFPPSAFRIVVTHHAFIKPPDSKRKKTIRGALRALLAMEASDIDLVLAGHFHRSVSKDARRLYPQLKRQIVIAQAGTAISKRLKRERNAYNLISISRENLKVQIREWDGTRFIERSENVFQRSR